MTKIVSVQLLRGFAATVVAGFHLYTASISESGDPGVFRIFAGGEIGVDIFFVISGFIIFYVSQSRPNLTYKKFLAARFWRIFPPYWAILTLYVLAGIALFQISGDASKLPTLTNLAVSYFLLPYPDYVLIIAWTLALEILFYAVFSLSYFTGGTRGLLAAMGIWVLLSQGFHHIVEDKPDWLLLPLHTAALEFLFGILIAIDFLSTRRKKSQLLRRAALVLGCISVAYYLFSGGVHNETIGREIFAGLPAMLLVYGSLGELNSNLSATSQQAIEEWGECSYTLYLFHLLFFSVVGKAFELIFDYNVYHSQLLMLCMLAAVTGVSLLSSLTIERHYKSWYRQFITSSAR